LNNDKPLKVNLIRPFTASRAKWITRSNWDS